MARPAQARLWWERLAAGLIDEEPNDDPYEVATVRVLDRLLVLDNRPDPEEAAPSPAFLGTVDNPDGVWVLPPERMPRRPDLPWPADRLAQRRALRAQLRQRGFVPIPMRGILDERVS